MPDELTPTQVADLRMREMINKLWTHPELGSQVRKLAKETYPEIQLPEDQVDPVVAPLRTELESLRAELKAEKEDREKRDTQARELETRTNLEKALSSARGKYNLTDDGYNKMIDRMKETGNYSDADAAAAWVAVQNPPAAPSGSTWAPQDANLFGTQEHDEKFKLLHTNPEKYRDNEIAELLRDPDKYVRETFGQV